MKPLHVHMAVDDLEQSIGFYSTLLGTKPTKQKPDYAQWMLDDPRVNFAISAHGVKAGLDHFGIQVDAPEELEGLRQHLKHADLGLFDEGETTCYAASDKSWGKEPSDIAWENYHTTENAELFSQPKEEGSACCAPKAETKPAASRAPKSGCC